MGQSSGKSTPQAMSANQSLEITRKVNEAHSKAVDVEKRVQDLELIVNDKNQWNNTVRGWINSAVIIRLLTGEHVEGTLIALDRYTLLVDGRHFSNTTFVEAGVEVTKKITEEDARPVIIHKGAIATICQGEPSK